MVPTTQITRDGLAFDITEDGPADGEPVLLLHGFPQHSDSWDALVPLLTEAGYRTIRMDQRGYSPGARPRNRSAYRITELVNDAAEVIDHYGGRVHVVGHDWGAAVAWLTAMFLPDRVRTLTAVSVPYLGAPDTARQREMAWYQLFFQFEEVAEANLRYDDWAALRELTPGYLDIDRAIENLSRPGALTASMNWYRANLAPRMPGPRPQLPPVKAPTLGIWSDGDRYLDGARMRASGDLVKGPWRYAEVTGASHWIPLDAPEELNALLLDWLGSPR